MSIIDTDNDLAEARPSAPIDANDFADLMQSFKVRGELLHGFVPEYLLPCGGDVPLQAEEPHVVLLDWLSPGIFVFVCSLPRMNVLQMNLTFRTFLAWFRDQPQGQPPQ